MAAEHAEHHVWIGPKVRFLDSRYSYIISIGSLTYSSTLSFIYGIEIHGRGLAEGPATVL